MPSPVRSQSSTPGEFVTVKSRFGLMTSLKTLVSMPMLVIASLGASWWLSGQAEPLYTARSSQAGHAAIAWIQEHVPPGSTIIGDASACP